MVIGQWKVKGMATAATIWMQWVEKERAEKESRAARDMDMEVDLAARVRLTARRAAARARRITLLLSAIVVRVRGIPRESAAPRWARVRRSTVMSAADRVTSEKSAPRMVEASISLRRRGDEHQDEEASHQLRTSSSSQQRRIRTRKGCHRPELR